MKFLPYSWRSADMIVKTFYNLNGVVNRVIYELPVHEEVHKDTKMKLVENNGRWYVIADTDASSLEGKVTRSLAENKNRVVYV
jgi:hypothetical protein